MKGLLALLLALSLDAAQEKDRPVPGQAPPIGEAMEDPPEAAEEKPRRPDDKTLVAALDVEQGEGKERLSFYRDGTLALVRTYAGVRTVQTRVLSEEEVDLVRRVCLEAAALDVGEYRADVQGPGKPRRFRIEVARPDAETRVFLFDELARTPLVLGRARGALEGLLARFDEKTVSEEDLWDPSGLVAGDVLAFRADGKRFRIVRDDAFVRSLELLDVERSLHRLFVLREEVPRLFFAPPAPGEKAVQR